MRKRNSRAAILATLLVVCGIAAATIGCESSSDGASAYLVTYRVETYAQEQGSAVINRVFYDDDTGEVELALDPAAESWSDTVLLAPGDTFYLKAEGTVDAGYLYAQIQIEGDDGSLLARTADGMPISNGDVFLEIPRETLP